MKSTKNPDTQTKNLQKLLCEFTKIIEYKITYKSQLCLTNNEHVNTEIKSIFYNHLKNEILSCKSNKTCAGLVY